MPRIAPINTLTTLQCQNVKGPAVLNDGRGLRLERNAAVDEFASRIGQHINVGQARAADLGCDNSQAPKT
jgi:hypothetical protein